MSDSYPTIQDALSEVQKDFLGCVEMHLDPPEHGPQTYAVESTYRCTGSKDAIRFKLAVVENESDLLERRHTIEFVDPDGGRLNGFVRHRMKRVEAMNGRYFWTESRFEVAGPGIPEGRARQVDVEREVGELVDKIRALDRAKKLVEV